jgi:hypothetical protein
MYMSKREKSWSWISRRLKPGITVLAKASNTLTNCSGSWEGEDTLGAVG